MPKFDSWEQEVAYLVQSDQEIFRALQEDCRSRRGMRSTAAREVRKQIESVVRETTMAARDAIAFLKKQEAVGVHTMQVTWRGSSQPHRELWLSIQEFCGVVEWGFVREGTPVVGPKFVDIAEFKLEQLRELLRTLVDHRLWQATVEVNLHSGETVEVSESVRAVVTDELLLCYDVTGHERRRFRLNGIAGWRMVAPSVPRATTAPG
jgi:hypothetical protein